MKIEVKKYGGQWIACKNERVIDSNKGLKKLMNKMESRKDKNQISYMLVPRGLIAG